jgi:hypothetical protein
MNLQERIDSKIAELKSLEKDFPTVMVVHDIRDSSVCYMSQLALDGLGVTMEELIAMKQEYHTKFFNSEDSAEYVPKIFGLLARNNDDEVVSFYQQVRKSPDLEWTWYLSSIRILLKDDDGSPVLTLTTSVPAESRSHVSNKAQPLIGESKFRRENR